MILPKPTVLAVCASALFLQACAAQSEAHPPSPCAVAIAAPSGAVTNESTASRAVAEAETSKNPAGSDVEGGTRAVEVPKLPETAPTERSDESVRNREADNSTYREAAKRRVTITSKGATGDSIPNLASRLMSGKNDARGCYNEQIMNGARPRGEVAVKLKVNGDGRIIETTATGDTSLPLALLECTAERLGQWAFEPTENGRSAEVVVFVNFGV
jgi:hypothetical protein